MHVRNHACMHVLCLECGHRSGITRVLAVRDGYTDERWKIPIACARCGRIFGRRQGIYGAWPIEPPAARRGNVGRPFTPRRSGVAPPDAMREYLSPISIEIVDHLLPRLQQGEGVAAAGRRLGLTAGQTKARLDRLERAVSRWELGRRPECDACRKPLPLDARRTTQYCPGLSKCREAARRRHARARSPAPGSGPARSSEHDRPRA